MKILLATYIASQLFSTHPSIISLDLTPEPELTNIYNEITGEFYNAPKPQPKVRTEDGSLVPCSYYNRSTQLKIKQCKGAFKL